MEKLERIPIEGNIVQVDDTYTIMVIKQGKEYECYGKKNFGDSETPFMYMFGELCDSSSFREAVDLAIANIPFYDNMFD